MSKCIICEHEHESIPEDDYCLNCIEYHESQARRKVVERERFGRGNDTFFKETASYFMTVVKQKDERIEKLRVGMLQSLSEDGQCIEWDGTTCIERTEIIERWCGNCVIKTTIKADDELANAKIN